MGYEHYRQTLSKNVDMKNYFADNNYGIRFKSKTEAIEQLCLKVFGATPVYESSLEELKTEEIEQLCLKVFEETVYGSSLENLNRETVESMYANVVSIALECDPIPAKDRADGKIEPPWEVFARVKRERDIWIAEAERWRKNTDLYHTVLGQRDRLAEAIRKHRDELELTSGDSVDRILWNALTAVKENQKTDSQSCPECDVLASHGANDGPCETHKL